MSAKELKLLNKIEQLNKKVNELYKYKTFVELEKNSKSFYAKFEKINNNNILLVNHIKSQKTTIELLIREKDEYKKKLTQLKDDGLTFVNKKKFYEINLKINELEKSNHELKNIIKNKENIFLKLNIEITDLKKQNDNYNNLILNFMKNFNSIKTDLNNQVIQDKSNHSSTQSNNKDKSDLSNQENKQCKLESEKELSENLDENSESEKELEEISDSELDEIDDNIFL